MIENAPTRATSDDAPRSHWAEDARISLDEALEIVTTGRAHVRKHYPVGHPDKFVGHHPADLFDAAVDRLAEGVTELRCGHHDEGCNWPDIPCAFFDEREELQQRVAQLEEGLTRLSEGDYDQAHSPGSYAEAVLFGQEP